MKLHCNLRLQLDRYSACFEIQKVSQLTDEFGYLKQYSARCNVARSQAEYFKNCMLEGGDVFTKARNPFHTRKLVLKFDGSLATVSPG